MGFWKKCLNHWQIGIAFFLKSEGLGDAIFLQPLDKTLHGMALFYPLGGSCILLLIRFNGKIWTCRGPAEHLVQRVKTALPMGVIQVQKSKDAGKIQRYGQVFLKVSIGPAENVLQALFSVFEVETFEYFTQNITNVVEGEVVVGGFKKSLLLTEIIYLKIVVNRTEHCSRRFVLLNAQVLYDLHPQILPGTLDGGIRNDDVYVAKIGFAPVITRNAVLIPHFAIEVFPQFRFNDGVLRLRQATKFE